MTDEVLATIAPTPIRRYFAVALIVALGALLIYLGIAAPPAAFGWQLFLLGGGVLALMLADMVRRATAHAVVMTETELRDTAGRLLCRVEDIAGVDRGAFAFKPSNGFLIRLSKPGSRVWAPGLWWRFGRRIGVGGVTPAAQARYMSELIAVRLAERDPHSG